MNSLSEKSFGSRLLNAQNILTYIQALADYEAPQATESIISFKKLQDDIIESNTKESELKQNYRKAVKNRQSTFYDLDTSLFKLLPPIRGAVIAAYGKNSQEADSVTAIINKIRASKIIQPPAPAEGQEAPQTISTSQKSYGSLTKSFNDLINTLTQLGGYHPSNPNLQIANLQAFAITLDTLNFEVAQSYQKLAFERQNRLNLYKDLSQRVQRIKSYIQAQYGLTSKIYSLVKGLSI